MEDTNKKNNASEKSMKYYDFYTKVYLLIIIFFNIFTTAGNVQDIQEWSIFSIISVTINIIFYIILQIKLREELILKTKLGYRLLLTFLMFDIVYKTLVSTVSVYLVDPTAILGMYAIIFFLIYAIWTIPNLIYFIKRKEIFINEKNRIKKENVVENIELINNKIEETIEHNEVQIDEDIKIVEKANISKKKDETNVWKILTIILIFFSIAVLICAVLYMNKINGATENLLNEIANLEKENKELEQKYIKGDFTTTVKAKFFDKYVRIVPKNTKLYHKYDCQYCDTRGATLIFINDTKEYKPCSHCIK